MRRFILFLKGLFLLHFFGGGEKNGKFLMGFITENVHASRSLFCPFKNFLDLIVRAKKVIYCTALFYSFGYFSLCFVLSYK